MKRTYSRTHHMPCVSISGPNRPKLRDVVKFAQKIKATKIRRQGAKSNGDKAELYCIRVPWAKAASLGTRRLVRLYIQPAHFRDYYVSGDKRKWL